MNNINSTIEKMCNFPIDAYELNKSSTELYKISEYNKYYKQITIDNIKEFLLKNEELLWKWDLWSQDKRYTPSWAFYEHGDNWIVELILPSGEGVFTSIYKNKIDACALFIKMDFELLRRNDFIKD